jgi:hypothetical protein
MLVAATLLAVAILQAPNLIAANTSITPCQGWRSSGAANRARRSLVFIDLTIQVLGVFQPERIDDPKRASQQQTQYPGEIPHIRAPS